MNANDINAYLERAREIIGERSPGEIAYDSAVVRYLRGGMDIRRAVRKANQDHPDEALEPKSEHWDDLASRYEYMAEHEAILKRLGIKP